MPMPVPTPVSMSEVDLAETGFCNIVSINVDDQQHGDEKSSVGTAGSSFNSSQANMNGMSQITFHCLTFETELPLPYKISSNVHDESPPTPDLSKFISPFLWSKTRKDILVVLSCFATMLAAYTAGSLSPPAQAMADEWGVSKTQILIGFATFCFGFGIAPMVLAPFSEINGRYPVFIGSGIVWEICMICSAVTPSYAGMLVTRFWVGVGSSVFSTNVGGVISDMYHAEDRNAPMALFSGFVLIGTGLGPFVSGFIAQNLPWRWVFWLQTITVGLIVLALFVFFKETRGSILLSKKAQCLNRWYEERENAGYFGVEMPSACGTKVEIQRIRWKVKSDEERESLTKMITISVYRPFHLLFTEPVVFFFSLWVAFAWAVLYLTFGSIPLVFSVSHGFNIQQSGAIFASMSIASVISTFLSIYQERFSSRIFGRLAARFSSDAGNPEHFNPETRLYFACIESVLLPVGLFMFGWTQFGNIPWIVPAIAIGFATMGIFSIYLATFNYLADVYHRQASSAIAAQSFCRNLLGGIFPVVTGFMFNDLGFAPASSLLAGIAVILTLVPWILVFFGPRIRARSKIATEIM